MAAIVSCAMAMGRIGPSKPGWGLSRSVAPRYATGATWGRGQNSFHLVDPAEVGAADEEPRCAVAGSLPAWGVDWRLPGSPRRPLGQGRAEPVAGGDLAADRRMAGGLRRLAEARPLGEAIRVRVGGRGLPAGPDGR